MNDRELLELAAKAAGIRFDGFDEDRASSGFQRRSRLRRLIADMSH